MYRRDHIEEWIIDLHYLDTAASELGQFEDFKHLWDRKRKGENLPAWSDFDLMDFEDWWGWITVEDVIPGPVYDSRYRLWGSNIVDVLGADLTGQKMSDHVGTMFSHEDLAHSMEIVKDKVFRTGSGPVYWTSSSAWRDLKGYSFIQLPLADDGVNVDKLMDVIIME